MKRMEEQASSGKIIIPPPLSARGVILRPLVAEDAEALYEIAVDPRVSTRIRFRGATPSPAEFSASMFESVLTQFVITLSGDPEPVGAAVLSSPSFIDGHVHMSVFVQYGLIGSGAGFTAAILTINYAFATWPLRKLYLDVPTFNYRTSWNVGDRMLREEGRLRDHSYFEGRFWDLLFMACYREDAEVTAAALVAEWCSVE